MNKLILLLFSTIYINLNAQHCYAPTAQIDLDINNIRARLLTGGDMWWDGENEAVYQFPNIDSFSMEISTSLIHAGGLFISAVDNNNNLKVAAQSYRNQGREYWAGPLSYGSSSTYIEDTICTKYDRFFSIYKTEVQTHFDMLNLANYTLSWDEMSKNILEWPGRGNEYLQVNYGMEIIDNLAPYQDCNGNGFYDPANGDYPLMKGDQSIFWVINDIGNTHGITGGEPLEVEIQCMAYAYQSNDAVNNATFYDYRVIKKSTGNLNDFYFSQFIDPDIEGFSDDFNGCDTVLDYAFAYNSENSDINPILIAQFTNTPNNIGLSTFKNYRYMSGSDPIPSNSAEAIRNYHLGKWQDGSPITFGGTGIGGTEITKFLYPGNPSQSNEWSECSAGNLASDRRFIMTTGPYSVVPGIALDFSIAIMIAETDPNTYDGCPDKITLINPVVNTVNNFIDNVDDNPYSCKVLTGIFDLNNESLFVYPNPSNGKFIVELPDGLRIESIEILDILGKKVDFTLVNNKLNLKSNISGIYFLKTKQGNNIVKKLIIK